MKKIAIIGYSGIFPDANSTKEFGENLKNKHNSIKKISDNRLDDTYISKDEYSYGGYLENISFFDHKFFNIPFGEAIEMSPDQRILLEQAYKTFENAGYKFSDLKGRNISVYTGYSESEYYLLADKFSTTLVTGNMSSLNAGRISSFFDFKGPAINVDTTCSSTLSSLVLACREIILDETEMSLVCGSNIKVIPQELESDFKMGIESFSDKCSPFSSNADGAIEGEAVACVLLKDLDKAIADQDLVYGIILAAELNHDGKTSSGITAPNSEAQTELIKKAINRARIKPSDISFIEAHGTGTKIGDPIEIEGLSGVFSKVLDNNNYIYVSSVKSNIGHTDSAAGIVGLIKVLESFKNGIYYPSINALPPNEFIDFEESKVKVLTEPIDFKDIKKNRIVSGVSSFGLMGTNAHVILEKVTKHKKVKTTDYKKDDYLFCISAKSKVSLKHNIDSFYGFLSQTDNLIHDVVHSQNSTREIYKYRYKISGKSKEDIKLKLKSFSEEDIEYIDFKNTILLFDEIDEITNLDFYRGKYVNGVSFEDCDSLIKKKIFVQLYCYQIFADSTRHLFRSMVGYGIGKISIKIINGELTLVEVIGNIDNYVREIDNSNFDKRLSSLLKKYQLNTHFICIGINGVLGNEINRKINSIRLSKYDIFDLSVENTCLSTFFSLEPVCDFKYLYSNIDYNKVELPNYSFEKIKCWIKSSLPYYSRKKEKNNCLSSNKENTSHEKVETITKDNLLSKLISLWSEVLKENISEKDDFFDLGGNSLSGQQLINRINSFFSLDLNLDTLFEFGTPNLMKEYLLENNLRYINDYTNVKKRKIEEVQNIHNEIFDASSAQTRMWISSIFSNNTSSLVVPSAFLIEGELDYSKLNDSFSLLIERHDSLRTNFFLENDILKQKVQTSDNFDFSINVIDLSFEKNIDLNNFILSLHNKPFNLDKDPLIRVDLIKLSQEKYIISIALHHIICDGWSINLINKELLYIYNCMEKGKRIELPQLTLQYKDYVKRLLEKEKTPAFKNSECYWLEKFSTVSPEIYLEKQSVKNFSSNDGAIKEYSIPQELADKILDFCDEKRLTLTMLIGVFINILLYKLSGNKDITIGIPISRRDSEDLENQIGLFLDMLPYRLVFDDSNTFLEMIEKSRIALREGYSNNYPFELLLEKLRDKKINFGPSLFNNIVFSTQNFNNTINFDDFNSVDSKIKINNFDINGYSQSQFNIAYRFYENDRRISYEIEYNTGLFSELAIEYYHQKLIEVISCCFINFNVNLKNI